MSFRVLTEALTTYERETKYWQREIPLSVVDTDIEVPRRTSHSGAVNWVPHCTIV